MLRPLSPDLWTVDFPRSMLGIQFGGRMTVLIVSHGQVLETGAREALRGATAWCQP